MSTAPDPKEAARRLRAAMAYVGLSDAEAAEAIGVSVATLARMKVRKGSEIRSATWDELWRAADAFGLPRAWFTFDMARLAEIVPDDMPGFSKDVGSAR